MPMSNFGYFKDGITVRGMPLNVVHPGSVFFVNNSSVIPSGSNVGSDSNDGSYKSPFASINYAVTQCSAGRGDVIMVHPGHVETVSSAGGLTVGTSGVCIVGLGSGSLRPTVNFTATTATCLMTANNCTFSNMLFTGGITAVAKMIIVSGADCCLDNCETRDVTGVMTNAITTTAAANRLKVLGHTHRGSASAGATAFMIIVGGDGIEVTATLIDGNFSVGGINIITTATTNLHVHDVLRFYNRNSSDIFLIDTITASTGQIGSNINLRLTDNAANITEACTGATFVYMQPINVVNLAGESSMQLNITASTDA